MKYSIGKFGTLIIEHDSCSPDQLTSFSFQVFKEISHLEHSYPNFEKWYFEKIVNGLKDGSRSIILEIRNEMIAGVAIIKDTQLEKKICTISVSQEYKSKGLGFKLFEKSMRLLNTDRPLASVSEDRINDFEKIFQHFNYEFSAEYKGLYVPKKSEFSFNGILQ
jgi:hypothetical protein